jgi:hypothetical protein
MDFTPPRRLGLIIGSALLALLISGIVLSVYRLATATISALIIPWVLLPLFSVPLALIILFRLYGLLSARYRLDRDGFYLTWGMAGEQIPLADITDLLKADEIASGLRPEVGFWWPGCVVGRKDVDGVGEIEFFATTGAEGMILLQLDERLIAISPPEVEDFFQAFSASVRMGSLEPIAMRSQRPDFIFTRLWEDRIARAMVLLGLALPTVLLGYLAVQAPLLPLEVPFGFDPAGMPDPLAPPGRLLLLPMIGGLCWMLDFVIGAMFYRQERDRVISYTIWGAAILVGALLWGATLQLLAFA